jgi:flagellar hook-length control protein FliK
VAEITPIASVAPATPAPSASQTASSGGTDGSGSKFMGQLSAALKSLKGLAKDANGPKTTSADNDASDDASATEDSTAKDDGAPDDIAELMATLGLMVLPTPQTPLTGDAHMQAQGGATPVDAQAGAALPLPQDAAAANSAQPAPQIPTQASADAAAAGAVPTLETPAAPTLPTTPAATATNATVAQAATAADGAARAPLADNAQPAQPQASTAALLQQPLMQPQLQDNTGGAFQQGSGSGDGHQRHGSSRTEPVGAVDAADPTASAQHLAEAANSVAGATSTAAAPAAEQSVHAGDVAQQIAQQVDLYRLPGSKGVRIQLHPDDLGGVQVTLKYVPGGNLELHISVEHASTGSLVQEGLSQLRDALATQGFHPDRMVMSITAPSGANAMDFSSSNSNSGNGSGFRSDVGFGSDGQGQSGQQREPGFGTAAGWQAGSGSDVDSVTSSSDSARGSLAASRIDYRV